MIKFRLYFDKDKETEFLNGMAEKGYAMTGFFVGFYSFEKCEPGEYIYQVDITEGLFKVKSDYREFMKEMNVEIVCLWGFWAVLRKRADAGPFMLYTDVESSIEHYSMIRRMFKKAAIVEIACLVLELIAGLRGYGLAWVFSCVLAAILTGMLKEVVRVNRIIAELKERRGEESGWTGRKMFSGYIPLGFLLNALGFLVPEDLGLPGAAAGSFWGFWSLSRGLHILALLCFLIGMVRTLLQRKE